MKRFVLSFIILLAGCSQAETAVMPDEWAGLYIAEDAVIGEGTEYALGGTLTLPPDFSEPLTAVVLIHSSGPSDRDGTIYGNKPFRDIAGYLSAHGFAVLRYDKRTYAYPNAKGPDFTVKEETVCDAVLAVGLLRNDPRIDPGRIFILGHGFGGMLAPRIDSEAGCAGMIIMAGSPRSLPDTIWDANMALIESSGLNELDHSKGIAKLMLEFEKIDGYADFPDGAAKETVFLDMTAYYLKEMDSFPLENYLQNLDKPVLFIQGGKDLQFSPENDFGGYERIFEGRGNASFRLYPELNHLFMPSLTGTYDDYRTPGKVDDAVLADIADWLREN